MAQDKQIDWRTAKVGDIELTDVATGRQYVSEVIAQMHWLMEAMRAEDDNKAYRELQAEHYNMVLIKRDLQRQMTKIVKERKNV